MKRILEYTGEIITPWSGVLRGKALVSKQKISFLGDVDIKTGVIVDPKSDIRGISVRGKILIFRGGRGSTVGASIIYGLKKRGNSPLAIITVETDPVVVAGAIFSEIPMVSKVSEEILMTTNTNDFVEILSLDGKRALIKVFKKWNP